MHISMRGMIFQNFHQCIESTEGAQVYINTMTFCLRFFHHQYLSSTKIKKTTNTLYQQSMLHEPHCFHNLTYYRVIKEQRINRQFYRNLSTKSQKSFGNGKRYMRVLDCIITITQLNERKLPKYSDYQSEWDMQLYLATLLMEVGQIFLRQRLS